MKLFKPKRKISIIYNNHELEIDEDFWLDICDDDLDLKEAIEEYVRNCDDFSVWVD